MDEVWRDYNGLWFWRCCIETDGAFAGKLEAERSLDAHKKTHGQVRGRATGDEAEDEPIRPGSMFRMWQGG